MEDKIRKSLRKIGSSYPIINTKYGQYILSISESPVYGITGRFMNPNFYTELYNKYGCNKSNGVKNFYNSDLDMCINSFITFIKLIK